MNSSYSLHKGNVPLLISMPHNGEAIPKDIAKTMHGSALKVPDTDWYMDKLYSFAQALGVSIITPKYNRYVIDLNRDPKGGNLYPGANSTELCPTTAFDLSPLYLDNMQPNEAEVNRRVEAYWQPYHQAIAETLALMKQQHGKAVLLEAHSILSQVPRFFEGQLPDFNFGTVDGESCAEQMISAVNKLNFSPYSKVTNGRFKGGYITRHFGQPANNVHALQLELSQRTYMHEPSNNYHEKNANEVKAKLKALVECLMTFAQQP